MWQNSLKPLATKMLSLPWVQRDGWIDGDGLIGMDELTDGLMNGSMDGSMDRLMD